MSNICITVSSHTRSEVIDLATSLQRYIDTEIDFSLESTHQSAHLCLVDDIKHAPYQVLTPEHIILSTAESDSICSYLGISLETYMKLCVALALVQRQALVLNPLLKAEDLIHAADENCLFNRRLGIQTYVNHLEHLLICPGCHNFYHCLGCDREMSSLQVQLDAWNPQTLR